MEKQAVREEDGLHDEWYKEAHEVKDIPTLTAFAEKLLDSYEHDYGTVCHAVTALAVAAANVGARTQGLTGFQAQVVTWGFIREFGAFMGAGRGPMSLVMYEHMLYPQYEKEFAEKTILQETWHWLRVRARELLLDGADTDGKVRAHWQCIVDGEVPFGYAVEKTERE